MPYRYREPFVVRLCEEIGALIDSGRGDVAGIEARLAELAAANAPQLSAYRQRMRADLGVPDTAFKDESPYYFADEPPVRTFCTSGTTSAVRGQVRYSARGLALMDASILQNARRHIIGALRSPVILRLVPDVAAAPTMVMAYGMARIAAAYGHPTLSTSVIGARGVDYGLLSARIAAAHVEGVAVVLIGASFAFVNVCDALAREERTLRLPPDSRIVDAGGFKGLARTIDVAGLRGRLGQTFGVAPAQCLNLFGMTELASQLYDVADVAVGPLGERPKGRLPYVWPEVRDAQTLAVRTHGSGLLSVVDLCIVDRPHRLLTGDRGIACAEGVAVAGRIERAQRRGCSLSLDALTGEGMR
jgi:hypothetical protein